LYDACTINLNEFTSSFGVPESTPLSLRFRPAGKMLPSFKVYFISESLGTGVPSNASGLIFAVPRFAEYANPTAATGSKEPV
jgi:hypothetical protein